MTCQLCTAVNALDVHSSVLFLIMHCAMKLALMFLLLQVVGAPDINELIHAHTTV